MTNRKPRTLAIGGHADDRETFIDKNRLQELQLDSRDVRQRCGLLAHASREVSFDRRQRHVHSVSDDISASRPCATSSPTWSGAPSGTIPPALAQATVRAAGGEGARRAPACALVAGGKSFGGRMTSQAQAAAPIPGVRGLAFLGFPLHPAGRPSDERARHLFDVRVPMLFLQGSRDALADLALLRPVIERLGGRASLRVFEEADHVSFHVPAKGTRTSRRVLGRRLLL